MLDSALGAELKQKAAKPGPWYLSLGGFGEILPSHDNRVTLDRSRKDKSGMPLLVFNAGLSQNELSMRKDMADDAAEMLTAAGYRDVRTFDRTIGVGLGIHEMGTARMGRDAK